MGICPVTGFTVPDTSSYCLACGKLNHNQSKHVSEKSGKRKVKQSVLSEGIKEHGKQ